MFVLHRTAAVLLAAAYCATPTSAQDLAAGKAAAAQCVACHSLDGSNGAGPTLKGILGRKAGSVPGFRYSRAMRTSSIFWDAKLLDAYLANPQQAVPGNVMPFSGIADATERANLLAYIASQQ